MKNILIKILILVAACFSFVVAAAEEGLTFPNDRMPVMTDDVLQASQQKGMQIYMNNCMGCHSLSFQRYQRTATDLAIPEEIMTENLIFSDAKIGDLMTNTMNKKAAANWFGVAPPDLSLISRSRGTDWLYNYLRAFYVDNTRPYGVNNSVFKDVGMPHALEEMQGLQDKSEKVKSLENDIAYAKGDIAKANKAIEDGGSDSAQEKIIEAAMDAIHDAETQLVELSKNGQYFVVFKDGYLTPEAFDGAMIDLVNFLDYVGEPIKQERKKLGVWVLLFIVFFGFVAYLLKKEYWKDIH